MKPTSLKQPMNDKGADNLRIAIVKQACDDYKDLLKGKHETARCNKKEIESFFKSQYFQYLCNIDGKYFIDRLRKEVKTTAKKNRRKEY